MNNVYARLGSLNYMVRLTEEIITHQGPLFQNLLRVYFTNVYNKLEVFVPGKPFLPSI
jgi:hypothetical protein